MVSCSFMGKKRVEGETDMKEKGNEGGGKDRLEVRGLVHGTTWAQLEDQ